MPEETNFARWIGVDACVVGAVERPRGGTGVGYQEDGGFAQYQEAIHAAWARKLIQERWMTLGGPASDLGLPTDPNFPPLKTADGHEVEFRGGTMHVLDNSPEDVMIDARYRVRITFQGLGLEMRQEQATSCTAPYPWPSVRYRT